MALGCPNTAGFSILAFRGIIDDREHESRLSDLFAGEQQGRKNINGNNADIVWVI